MLCYVGDPQQIWLFLSEGALDQVACGGGLMLRSWATVSGQPLDPGASHEYLDLTVFDSQSEAEGEFGIDSQCPIGALGGGVHSADLAGQPRVSDQRCDGCRERHG